MLRLDGISVGMDDAALTATLALEKGARVAVMGPSGAGKSTLLDVIAGFRRATAGRMSWDGADLGALPPERRPVSILFQDGNLFPHLTLERNLGLALDPRGRRPDRAAREAIAGALQSVGLDGYADRRPGALSGGQQSRAALARVLLQDRPILLLDEPFAALGPALKRDMVDLVAAVSGRLGALTLMVTHDPGDARRFAEQTILVADGVAHPPVDTETLFANPPEALRAYLGDQAPTRF